MTKDRRKLIAVAGTGIVAALVAAGVALASPPSGVTLTPVMVGHYGALDVKADKTDKSDPHDRRWDLFLKTKDATIVSSDRLVIAGGGHTGWHSHSGPVFGAVIAGSITVSTDNPMCPSTTYTAGQSFYEQPNVTHIVRNASASQTAEFVGIQIRPEGAAGRNEESQPNSCS